MRNIFFCLVASILILFSVPLSAASMNPAQDAVQKASSTEKAPPAGTAAPAEKAAPAGGNALVRVDQGVYGFSDHAKKKLEDRLAKLNAKYDVHVGVVFLKKLPAGKTAEHEAKAIVEGGNGYEQGSKGSMVLLVATDSRDYYIATGRNLNKIITSKEGIPYIENRILKNLKDNDYEKAATHFAGAVEKELAYYEENGEPYDPSKTFSILALLIAVLGSGVAGIGVRSYLISQMSNVHHAADADVYLDKESFELTGESDTFLYTKVKSVPKRKHSSSRSSDSGSTGGGGGKF